MPISPTQVQKFFDLYNSIGPNGPDERQSKAIEIVGRKYPHILGAAQQAQATRRAKATQQAVGFDPMSDDEGTTFGLPDRAVEQGFRELPEAINQATANPIDLTKSPILGAASDLVPLVNLFTDPYTRSAQEASKDPSTLYGIGEGVSRAVGAAVPVAMAGPALGLAGGTTAALSGVAAALPTTGIPGGALTGNLSKEDIPATAGIAINAASGGIMSSVARKAALARIMAFGEKAREVVSASKQPLSTALSENANILAEGIAGGMGGGETAAAMESAQRILQATRGGGDAAARELFKELPKASQELLKGALRSGDMKLAGEIIAKDAMLSVGGVTLQAAAEGRSPTPEELGTAVALPAIINAAEFRSMNKATNVPNDFDFEVNKINRRRAQAKTEAGKAAADKAEKEALNAPLAPDTEEIVFDAPDGTVSIDKAADIGRYAEEYYDAVYPNAAKKPEVKKAKDNLRKQYTKSIVDAIDNQVAKVNNSGNAVVDVSIRSEGVPASILRLKQQAALSIAKSAIDTKRAKGELEGVYVTKATLGKEANGHRTLSIELKNNKLSANTTPAPGTEAIINAASKEIEAEDGQLNLDLPEPRVKPVANTPENLEAVRGTPQGPDVPANMVAPDMFDPTTQAPEPGLVVPGVNAANPAVAKDIVPPGSVGSSAALNQPPVDFAAEVAKAKARMAQLEADKEIIRAADETEAEFAKRREANAAKQKALQDLADDRRAESIAREQQAESSAEKLIAEGTAPVEAAVTRAALNPAESAKIMEDAPTISEAVSRKVQSVEGKARVIGELYAQYDSAKGKIAADWAGVKARFERLINSRGKTAAEINSLRKNFRAAGDKHAARLDTLEKDLVDAITTSFVANDWLGGSPDLASEARWAVWNKFGETIGKQLDESLRSSASAKAAVTRAEKAIGIRKQYGDEPGIQLLKALNEAADTEGAARGNAVDAELSRRIDEANKRWTEQGIPPAEVETKTAILKQARDPFPQGEVQDTDLALPLSPEESKNLRAYQGQLARDILEDSFDTVSRGSAQILEAIERERLTGYLSDKQAGIVTNLVKHLAPVMDGLGVKFSSRLDQKGLYSPTQNLISISRKLSENDLYGAIHEFLHPIAKFLPAKLRREALHGYVKDLVETIGQYEGLLKETTDPMAKARIQRRIDALKSYYKKPTNIKYVSDELADLYRFTNPDEWFVDNLARHEINSFGEHDMNSMLGRGLAYTKLYMRDFWEFVKSLYGGEDKARAIWRQSRDAANLLPSGNSLLTDSLISSPEVFDGWTKDMESMALPSNVDAELLAQASDVFGEQKHTPLTLRGLFKAVADKNFGLKVEKALLSDINELRYAEQGIDKPVETSAVAAIHMARNASSIAHTNLLVSPVTADANGRPIPFNEVNPQAKVKSVGEIVHELNQIGPVAKQAFEIYVPTKRLLARQDAGKLADIQRSKLASIIRTYPEIVARKTGRSVEEISTKFEELAADWDKSTKVPIDFLVKTGMVPDAYGDTADDYYFRLDKLKDDASIQDMHKVLTKGGLGPLKVPIDEFVEGKGGYNASLEPTIRQINKMYRAGLENVARRNLATSMEELGMGKRLEAKDQFAKGQGKKLLQFYEKGKEVFYEVDDNGLSDVLMNLGPEESNWLIRLMGIPKRVLSAGVVNTPDYLVRAFFREGVNNFLVTGGKDTGLLRYGQTVGEIFPSYVQDQFRAIRENPELLRLSAAGVLGGGFYDIVPDSLDSIITGKRSATATAEALLGYGKRKSLSPKQMLFGLADWMHRAGSAEEAASFLQQYRGAKSEGLGEAAAIETARKLLNRSLTPGWKSIRIARALIPFLQPRLAGLDALSQSTRAALGGKGYMVTPAQASRIKARVLGMSIATVALGILNRTANREKFDKLEDWQKRTYWAIPFGGAMGHDFLMPPKPFELSILANLADTAVGLFFGEDKGDLMHFLEQNATGVGQSLEVNPVPQALMPLVEDFANRSFFTDRPIVTPAQAELIPSEQYGPATSQTAKTVAQTLGKVGAFVPDALESPARLEHFLRGYLGTSSAYILGATDAMLNPFIPGEAPSSGGLAGLAYRATIRPITAPTDPRSEKYLSKFYDTMQDVRRLNNTYQQYKDTGRNEQAKEFKEDNKEKLALAGKVLSVNKRIAALNERAKKVREDTRLTGKQKQDAIDELNKQKNKLAREFQIANREVFN